MSIFVRNGLLIIRETMSMKSKILLLAAVAIFSLTGCDWVRKQMGKPTSAELEAMCSRSGGFVSHFGTSDSDRIHNLVVEGDGHAVLVWNAMIYQICKSVGAMAAVLGGRVDAILLTGGLVRFDDIVDGITKRCGWIAPVCVYKGEVEQEELCGEVLKVLRGTAKAARYTGHPVFSGFSWG